MTALLALITEAPGAIWCALFVPRDPSAEVSRFAQWVKG